MSLKYLLILALFFSLFLETTVITFPLVYITALVLYILYPDALSVFLAFLAGIILDSLKLTPIGITSLVILFSFVFIEVVKKVFELKDYRLVTLMVAILSFIFARTFYYTDNIFLYLGTFGIGGFLINYFHNKSPWQR